MNTKIQNPLEVAIVDLIVKSLLVKATKRGFNRTRYQAELRIRTRRAELRMKSIMRKFFKAQMNHVNSKKDIYSGWMFDLSEWNERLVNESIEFIKILVAEQGSQVLRKLRLIVPGLEISFDVENPYVQEWIRNHVFEFANQVNETTQEALRTQISEGLAAGEGTGEIATRIESVYEEASGYRAERISRTEVMSASNQGAIEGYRQSKVVGRKEWLTADGCCEDCLDLSGEVVGIDEMFSGGVESPPLHPNCLCCVLPVIEEGE